MYDYNYKPCLLSLEWSSFPRKHGIGYKLNKLNGTERWQIKGLGIRNHQNTIILSPVINLSNLTKNHILNPLYKPFNGTSRFFTALFFKVNQYS